MEDRITSYTFEQLGIAQEIIAILRSHNLNYEDAKKAIECTDQILLKRLLKNKKDLKEKSTNID